MKLRILGAAIADLEHGCQFYEAQAEGLGKYFLDSLSSDIDSLAIYAGIHEQHEGYFRLLAQRFPYAVYYRIEGEHVDVWRVLDCRRDPGRIRAALKSGR